MADLNLPPLSATGDDVWGQTLNDNLVAINGEAEGAAAAAATAATNAATALSTANTASTAATAANTAATTASTAAAAATSAVAGKADDTAVVKLTGAQTVAGAKNFTTPPTVSSVPVATTADLGGYVPATSAATIDLTDIDGDNTGDMVVHAGSKTATFTWLAGVLQGGMLEDGEPTEGAWADKIVGRWDAPFTTPTSLAATVGTAPLVGTDNLTDYREHNHAPVSALSETGLAWRGVASKYETTLDTEVPAASTLGYTTMTWLTRVLTFDGAGEYCHLGSIGSDGAGGFLVFARIIDGGATLVLRAETNGVGQQGAVTTPAFSTFTLPGDSTPMTSALGDSWHVVTLALKQGALGKMILDSTTVVTGIDSDACPATAVVKLRSLSELGGVHHGGMLFNTFAVGAAMTDADITAMHADLLASVA